ncbi:hypothetical protein EHS14_02450 [Schaalia georgiae]|nr:hypothetical protein EHS14_02450 [Schaalia georgiae]
MATQSDAQAQAVQNSPRSQEPQASFAAPQGQAEPWKPQSAEPHAPQPGEGQWNPQAANPQTPSYSSQYTYSSDWSAGPQGQGAQGATANEGGSGPRLIAFLGLLVASAVAIGSVFLPYLAHENASLPLFGVLQGTILMIGTAPVVVVALASWFVKKRWALIASVVLGGVAAVVIAGVAIWVVMATDHLGVFTLSYGWYIGVFSALLMVVATVLQALGLKKSQGGAAGSQPGAGGPAQSVQTGGESRLYQPGGTNPYQAGTTNPYQ